MLRFILDLLYFFRFHFAFFICWQLCWIRGLCISFTSCLFPVDGRSKKFEDWGVTILEGSVPHYMPWALFYYISITPDSRAGQDLPPNDLIVSPMNDKYYINLSCLDDPRRWQKIYLNFYFHTSLWCLKRFYKRPS